MQAAAAALALDVATAASLAVAPAIAWYSGSAMGGAVAVALLVILTVDVALNAKRGRVHALIQCAPYVLFGLATLFQSADFTSVAIAGLAIGYVFVATLHQTHRAAHARLQDAEWVRQLNMSFGESAAVGWEIDFMRGRVAGAQRLGRLIGRPISYTDIVERGFFAQAHDRALVNAAFSPAAGAVRVSRWSTTSYAPMARPCACVTKVLCARLQTAFRCASLASHVRATSIPPEACGQPPARFLLQVRMKIAARRLQGGDSVLRAAEHVGYHSQAAFTRAFKKVIGEQPGAFQRARRGCCDERTKTCDARA